MFDQYHYDRALYGASHLPNHPIPQRFDFRGEESIRDGVPHRRTWVDLKSPENIPLEVTHRVAELVVLAKPDRFALVTYMVVTYGRYEFPRNLIDPVVYALYNDWAIKVAEWE